LKEAVKMESLEELKGSERKHELGTPENGEPQ